MATNLMYLPSLRWHRSIESTARVPGGTSAAKSTWTKSCSNCGEKTPAPGTAGRSSKTLAKYPDFRIVLIPTKSGTRMRQHKAEGESPSSNEGERLYPPGRAKGDCVGRSSVGAGLRRVARRRSAGRERFIADLFGEERRVTQQNRFRPLERHLDEQAASRMDDEGGTHGATDSPAAAEQNAGPGN